MRAWPGRARSVRRATADRRRPPGHGTHHYFFHLYALDQPSGVSAGADRAEVMAAIDGHIIEQARIVGTFST